LGFICFNVSSSLGIFFTFAKKAMPSFHSLRVSGIDRASADAVVVSLEVPESLKESYTFTPGQYVSLETTIDEVVVRRSYSLCSTPDEPSLRVGVKKLDQGVFSTYINESLKLGDSLKVSIPEGRFVYEADKNEGTLLAIAAGSGITPIFSILNSFLAAKNGQKFTLIYGNKSPEQTMFYQEIKDLEAKYSEQLSVHWVFSQSSEEGTLFGRINPSVINFVLNQQNRLPDHSFLCGPEPMIISSSEQLQRKGASKDRIYFELFTASSDTVEVENQAEKGRFTITCDELTHTLDLVPDKTLLDIALGAKLEVPYSCQGGVCSSCIAKVKEGKASMITNQILTDNEIEEGFVLSCQAIAQSETIHLDYDDV
jgi:ring-1,2-phenylacetyl-CoA epoxidase subunit PaaE